MRTLVLLLAMILGGPVLADGQQPPPSPEVPVIEAAEVAGLGVDQLSPGLRADIQALAGQPLNRDHVGKLAARIEAEHPDVVAAARDVARPDGRVRVVFLVARITDDAGLVSNINARYTVEEVEVSGIDEARISQELRDALRGLVGDRLDPVEADALTERLEGELPDYDVRRRISRGSEPGRIRVVFSFTRAESRRWIRFPPSRSKLVYHEDQGWSGVFDFQVGGPRNNQVSLGLVRGNGDDLIEEYSGYWFRVENREVGTRRLGVSLEVSRFTQKWDPATLSALESNPNLADLYRRRLTVQPAVTVAFSPHVRLTAGASVSELRPLSEASGSQMASAFVAAVGYDQTWKPTPDASHHAAASYQIRAGTAALDSDLIYRRHFGQARYRFEQGRSSITADLLLGRLTGRAPMFERFSLGDTSTLRGWNKFDIVPAGADRLVHQSVEYRYRSFAYFVDLGSVWTAGTDARLRLATGIGFHSDHAFVTFGFPLNADAAGAMFMLGVRLGARF